MAGHRAKEKLKRKKGGESPLPTPPTSTEDKGKGKAKSKKRKIDETPLPTPPTSTEVKEKKTRKAKEKNRDESPIPVASPAPKRREKGEEEAETAEESAHDGVELPDEETMDADDEELIWDPEVSYVGKFKLASQEPEVLEELEPERKLWKKEGTPIIRRSDIPKEWKWHDREPDLSKDDIEGQIKRAKERIEAGILPIQFEVRLRDYEAEKAHRDWIWSHFPGKSFAVARRLKDLHLMRDNLYEKGEDEYKHLPNIEAIIQAYESGELEWNEGLVTYWSYGKQLCKPRPWDIDEFLKVNRAHGGHESFWAEGAFPLQPYKAKVMVECKFGTRQRDDFHSWLNLSLKIPGTPNNASLDLLFMDDTGAGMMCINNIDIKNLYAARLQFGPRANARMPPIVGRAPVGLADGSVAMTNVVMLEVNYPNPPPMIAGTYAVPNWSRIQVAVWDAPAPGAALNDRLNGPWLRSQMFTATVPDGKKDLWITDDLAGLGSVVSRRTPHHPGPAGALKPLGRRPDLYKFPLEPAGAKGTRPW